ncbi:MAG: hypothetical protein AAB686_03140, partial [Patescibacteria group bacterium]
ELALALRQAGFIVHSVESRALSLARVVRQLAAGFDPARSYLVLSMDASGLEFLVIRRSQLYFQYFTPWRDVYGGEKEISSEAFANVIIRNFHQVLNFYNSHWSEPLGGVFLSTISMKDEISRIVRENFSLTILELQLQGMEQFAPDWYVAVGSGLRGFSPRHEDRDISLLGISARDEYRREQAINFLNFWRVLVPVSLMVLLVAFVGSDMFLRNRLKFLGAESSLNLGEARVQEIKELQARVADFNNAVGLIQQALSSSRPKTPLFGRMEKLLLEHDINLIRINFQDSDLPVILTGEAASENEIRSFYEAMRADKQFHSVNLPLADIKYGIQEVSFTMTFGVSPSIVE